MNVDILSNLVISKVDMATTIFSPEKAGSKRTDRPRWAIVIKYEGETFYETNGQSRT